MSQADSKEQRVFARWRQSALLAVTLLLLSFVALSLYVDASQLRTALEHFTRGALLPALAWSLLSYGLRAVRFQFYLRDVGIRISGTEALLVFLGGMSLSATPGKLGELLKSVLLKRRHGVPFAASVPVIIIERVSDLLALLLLTAWGVWLLPHGLAASMGLLGLALLVGVGWTLLPQLARSSLLRRAPLPARWATRLDGFAHSLASASRPQLLLFGAPLAIGSWSCQVLALSAVVQGFGLGGIALHAATFAYCVPLLAGVLAFLPGGLGVTEAGMVHSLQLALPWATPALAASVTLLVRLATFWFAIAVGAVSLLVHRRYFPWSAPPVTVSS